MLDKVALREAFQRAIEGGGVEVLAFPSGAKVSIKAKRRGGKLARLEISVYDGVGGQTGRGDAESPVQAS